MATGLRAGKGAATANYDAFVAAQLGRAENRIRILDLAAALLVFAAATLLYAVLMVFCDSKLELTARTRQTALLLYVAGASVYLALTVIRPWLRRINPYFAARKVEATLPGAKNSVVNWVDLHEQQLPPAIRGAVGQRAARDIRQADIERAISGRRTGWAGALVAGAVVALALAFFALGPGPFFSLLGRAFAPLRGETGIARRTRLAVVVPEGGDATVTVGRPVTIGVQVGGKVPDPKTPEAVRLQYRYDESEPYLERLLQTDSDREFSITISAIDVRNGFFYRVAGGDDVTAEHHIGVRAAPFLTDFAATYHYRPYVARADEVSRDRSLKALRGTEVLLLARTNRQVKEARLEWEGGERPSLPAQRLPADPQAFGVSLVLAAEGRYRLAFLSVEGETYIDPAAHEIKVILDQPPQIEITKPAMDLRLPADGLVEIEGRATDDIGVKSVTLRAKVVGGAKLEPRLYRPDEQMRLADGGYSTAVDYKDFLDLAKVRAEDGRPLALKAGMELEYWLEAADACDFDRPNSAESKHYKVQILEPAKDPAQQRKQRKQREKAEQDKKQQEKKQDQKQRQENKARQEERKQQEEHNAQELKKTEQPQQGEKAGQGGDPKNQEGGEKPPEQDPSSKDKPDQPGGRNKEADQGLNDEQKDKEKRLQEALQKKEQQEQGDGKGEPKGDNQQGPGEGKGDKQGDNAKGRDPKAGESKGPGQQGEGANGAGEGKDQGMQGADQKPGAPKNEGQPDPMNQGKGEGKEDRQQATAGNDPKAQSKPQDGAGTPQPRADAKQGGSAEQRGQAGQPKPDGQKGEQGQPKAEHKEAGSEGASPEGRQALGEKKNGQSTEAKSESKQASNSAAGSDQTPKGEPKGDGAARAAKGGQGDAKPANGIPSGQEAARGEPKPEGGTPQGAQGPKEATPQDVARLAKDLQSPDERTRQSAAERLEQIKDQARDAEARSDAREALDKAGQQEGSPSAGETKPQPSKGEPSGDPKEGTGNSSSGSSKPMGNGSPDKPQGDAKASTQPGAGEKKPGKANPNAPATAEGPGQRPAGNDPGQGPPGARGATERPSTAKEPQPKGKPSPAEAARAAMLQLDEFKKKVDKNVLKDAKMSEEDYQRFLHAYEDMVRRRKEQAARPEGVPGAQQAGSLPSFGGRRDKPADATSGTLESESRALPPAPYRDAYLKFTQQLSRPTPEKK